MLQAAGTLLWKDLNDTLGPVLWSSYTYVPGSVLKVNDDASFSIHDGTTNALYYTSSNSLSWNQTRAAPFSMFSPSKQFELALEIDGNLLIRDVLQTPAKTVWQTNKRRLAATDDMYLWMSVRGLYFISFICVYPL
jgi:NAD-dependent oxidoreductase involved in siderophore biosynthesis